jgi:hypothetical protein
MSLIQLCIPIIIVGLVLWAVHTFIPLDSKVRTLLDVVVIIALLLWVLQTFGLFSGFSNIRLR